MSPVRLDDEDVLRFIELYKESECLWNSNSVDYGSRDARNEAVKNIAKQMDTQGFGTEDVTKKIKSLRTSYSKELKKVQVAQKTGDSYMPKNFWFPSLDAFLRPYLGMGRRRHRSISNNMRQVGNNRRQSGPNLPAAGDEDEFDVFGRYVASHLRRLTMTQALHLESEFSKCLIEERMKQLSLQDLKAEKKIDQQETEDPNDTSDC